MRLSQDRVFDLLKEMFDPKDRWWWTAFGLVTLTAAARSAEGQFWAEVYLRLRGGRVR
jgi:hypothetical protein